MPRRPYADLRSAKWFTPPTRIGHIHRQRTKQAGFTQQDFAGKPVIGIFNTWSDLNPCHSHFRQRAEEVKRGVWQAGGFPVEVPVTSLAEPFMKPTTMLYRNLLAMEVEEMARCHPIDGLVLLGGCDKTTPAMLMGAITVNLPAIFVPAGAMLTGRWRGQTLGSGTDTTRYFMELKAGKLSSAEFAEMEEAGARSAGTCMTMGTASTMAALAEVLGFCLPGASSIPAPDSRHAHMASLAGRRAVDMVWDDVKPRDFLTRGSFLNAIVTLMALGGSTNAVVHLLAMARRAQVLLSIDDFGTCSATTPFLTNLKPSGEYLMEDFFDAGGLRALLREVADLLDLTQRGVTDVSLKEALVGPDKLGDAVIRARGQPLAEQGGIAVLRGNLAPSGCIIKRSAATPHLLQHRGRAVVFENYADLVERIDRPDLEVDADSILVLKNAGPRGAPGMPEWGMLPLPKKLLEQGVRDVVRISDARMSGTQFGTVVLHIAPEAALGGPLALVENGDMIELDVERGRLNLEVSDDALRERRARLVLPAPKVSRGWTRLYIDTVGQADTGCDLSFLEGPDDRLDPDIY